MTVRRALWISVAGLALPLAVPLLTGQVFPFGDLAALHLPLRHIYQQALLNGDSFLWTSSLGGGVYLHAEGQAGMAHPLHLLLYRLLPLVVAFNLELLISYAVALAGMTMLLRRLGHDREPALFGGVLFAFCGFNLMHFLHLNLVAVVAHIPWLLSAIDLTLRGETSRARAAGFAGASATFGSQILLSHPPALWWTLLILAWFVTYRLTDRAPWPRLWLAGGALAAGAAIGACQLLPSLELARESFRSAATPEFRLSYSLHPWNLLQLVSPYLFESRIYTPDPAERTIHELAVYNGAFTAIGIAWMAIRWRHLAHRRLAAAWLCLAALGLLLALGRYGGIYALVSHLPIVSGFRAPARHVLLAHLAFAGLGAIVLEDLLQILKRRHLIAWPSLLVVLVPVALGAAATVGGMMLTDRSSSAAAGFVPLLAAAALVVAIGRGILVAAPLLVVAAAIDLGVWGHGYVWSERPTRAEALVPPGGLPADARRGDLVHPFNSNNHVNRYPLWGLRSTRAYLGLYGEPVLSLYDPQTWTVMGVKWVWASARWLAWEDAMPRGRLVSDWRVSADPPIDMRDIDVRRTALVDAAPAETSGEPGTLRIMTDRPGHIVVETTTSGPQLLVLTERFHRGWRASAGHEPLPTLRMYGDLLGCRVPAGTHTVSLQFAPASTTWGMRVTLAGLVVTLLIGVGIAGWRDR